MTWRVEHGDCREVMARMEPESVTAIVSDPPYGLSFMGHGWDHSVPGVEFWTAALRVLKPGGMLLAFGGTRTWHRLACAIEDAGFVIRDSMMWLYGSGFPKSLDISKAIDKDAGAEREVVGRRDYTAPDVRGNSYANAAVSDRDRLGVEITAPATPAAREWHGYGTALKPAWEPVIVAMKPLDGTFVENALRHGVAGINVDGCRIATDVPWKPHMATGLAKRKFFTEGDANEIEKKPHGLGRWPANVILDEEAGAMLDAQSGESVSSGGTGTGQNGASRLGVTTGAGEHLGGLGDVGGASRFFYCAKADRSEREAGLDKFPTSQIRLTQNPLVRAKHGDDAGYRRRNTHATVKPLDLMRWLCRLVKMPKGTVILDPFCGSGSTGCAAVLENCDFIGIELNPEYANIARARIAHWEKTGAPLAQPKRNPAEMPGTPLFGDMP